MTTTTAMTMQEIMTSVGTIVTSSIEWIGDYVSVITGNPLILAFVVVSFVGLGVGLIKRMIRL